jgi:hypothetical protein
MFPHPLCRCGIEREIIMIFKQLCRRGSFLAFVMTALVLFAGPAKADQIFYFTFVGATVSGSGTLNGVDNGNGSFTAVSGTGTQISNGNFDILTLVSNPNAPALSLSPSGLLFYDNQLFPNNNPMITDSGLLFLSSTQEVNLFSNPGDGYQYFQQDGLTEMITFILSNTPPDVPPVTIPEPGSIVLLCISVLCFAATRRIQLGSKA